jgi:hypothetical protein
LDLETDFFATFLAGGDFSAAPAPYLPLAGDFVSFLASVFGASCFFLGAINYINYNRLS